jgi:hypothetical protein
MDLVLWLLWILPFWLLWGEHLRFQHGALVFNLKEGSWPNRTWYSRWGGTTLGNAIMYNYGRGGDNDRIQVHEEFHQKQYRGVMFSSFLTSLILFFMLIHTATWVFSIVTCAVLWNTGYLRWGLGNLLHSLISEEGNAYRNSSHEQAAYAIDAHYTATGERKM